MSLVEDENDVVTNVEIEGEETKVACSVVSPGVWSHSLLCLVPRLLHRHWQSIPYSLRETLK